LAHLDPDSPLFFEEASAIAEALIKVESSSDPFFDQSAQSFVLMFVMWEVKQARLEMRAPSLERVRALLTGDVTTTANEIIASGDFQLMSLAGRYTVKDNKTVESIKATADTKTRWLLSFEMRADLVKDGIDFARLKDECTTVYVILDADKLETFSVWLRLVVACALNALYRRGGQGLRTLFLLSEFAQLGHMKPITSALGQGRGYGIQLLPVLQDINQLRTNEGKDAANTFLGMSGATFAYTPNDSETAEWMSVRSGEKVVPSVSVSEDRQTGRPSRTVRSERMRRIPRDEMYNIPPFHGLVWFAGKSEPTFVYTPPYWDAKHNPDLVGRYDPDPYHAGTPTGKSGSSLIKIAAVLAALAAGMWALGPGANSQMAWYFRHTWSDGVKAFQGPFHRT
jgi:type IV secretion system protein VirD4